MLRFGWWFPGYSYLKAHRRVAFIAGELADSETRMVEFSEQSSYILELIVVEKFTEGA